jgi:flagellar hook assembly protein FlgD
MAKARDSMIRSTAGSNTEKWAGKTYKGSKKVGRKLGIAAVAAMKKKRKKYTNQKIKTGPKRAMKKKSSY